jgi:pimeloyl-ACP methyl ester carboxylesterase
MEHVMREFFERDGGHGLTRSVPSAGSHAVQSRRLHWLVLLMLLCQSAYATPVFRGTFEAEGRTPVRGAVVELRDAAEVVKASTISDEWSSFRPFAAATMQAGDFIVVYGGNWNDQPFAGEFRLLVDSASSPQHVDPISTVVTAVAGSALVSGTGAAQRLANAVTYLTDFGLIDSDWRNGSPLRVNQPLQDAISAAGGIQNWTTALLADLADADIASSWMVSFPHVHGGVAGLTLDPELGDWMSGEAGRYSVDLETTLPTPVAGWVYTLLQGPAWVTLSSAGELEFDVPAGTAPGTGSARIRVRNADSNRSRDLDLPYRIVTGTVLAQATYGALGGTLWVPDNSIGVQIADGTFSVSTDVQWVSYQTADGETMRVLRTQPRGRTFLLSPVLLTPGNQARATEGPPACPDGWQSEWETGWYRKVCTPANFVTARLEILDHVVTVVSSNRLPIGSQTVMPAQQAAQFSAPWARIASTFAARCEDCANRVPVLFVHGYLALGDLGGGSGTWGDLPAKLHAEPGANIAAYEFRYRSNARFQDIAADLGAAIEAIYIDTGHKVHIVAHSFGGLVARTYLQGLATNSQLINDPYVSCATSRHPFVASLLTLGTPHSGIAASAGTLNGTLLPNGRHFLGERIDECGQLSCWQAGEPRAFADPGANAFKTAFGVAEVHGWLPAELSRFEDQSQPLHPLSVPTLVMIGLAEGDDTNFAEGDGLISYQGQRFAPWLSCASGTCNDSTVGSAVLDSINSQSIGHCVYERVLGNVDPTQAPKPGSGRKPQTIYPQYVHFPVVSVAEANFKSAEHLDGGESNHDTLHRVRDWILRQDPDPGTRRLRMTVNGTGAIIVDNGGTILRCDSLPGFAVTTCPPVDVQANIRFRIEPAGANAKYTPTICSGDASNWCDWQVGAYEHIKAFVPTPGYSTVSVNVTGNGQVRVQPLNELCFGICIYQFPIIPLDVPGSSKHAPNTAITLTREVLSGGVWNQWSGACSGNQEQCSLTLAATSVPQAVTASFSGGAAPPPVGTGRLNDTGIQFCGAATTGNGTCSGSSPQGQDAYYGRDAQAAAGQLTKIGGGNAGFDYTKISNSGQPLPASAALGSGANDWACTRDNVTGLIWEVKVNNAAHVRHMDHTYTWYNSGSPDGNPGVVGTTSTCANTLGSQPCNTQTFTHAVNAAGLCGASDWRMPTRRELQSIVNYSQFQWQLAIDGTYFVNTGGDFSTHWSDSISPGLSGRVWVVSFDLGAAYQFGGGETASLVRLVRGSR